ncbi:MAG: hypothetical protein V1836_03585 [Candidatus Aenigmatarchaeota archaeon]
MHTTNKNNFIFWAIFSVVLTLPLFAAAAPVGASAVGASLLKMIGVPDAISNGGASTIMFYVVIPSIIMFLIMYGILDEIKLFYKGGINFAIAFFATLLTIPSGVLGQIIVGIYGGGLATLAIILGISLLPRFIDVFGPRTGLPTNILNLLSGVTYGFVMYYVFGLLEGGNALGGVLKDATWIKWVFAIGVPILVMWRGWWNRSLNMRMGSVLNVQHAEETAALQAANRCKQALRDLANVTATGGGSLAGVDAATYNNAIMNVETMCSHAYPEPYLRTLPKGTITKLANTHTT